MANEAILLRAEANKLGIDGYRKMPLDELRDAIKRAKGVKGKSDKPAKGKGKSAVDGVSTNGTNGKGKGKSSSPAKGKGKASVKSAPAKSEKQKSSPAKGKAAKGTAKRPTAAAKGKGKASSAKTAVKKAVAKGKATVKSAWQPGSRGRIPASATKKQLAEHKRIVKERAAERLAVPAKTRKSAKAVKSSTKRGKASEGRVVIDRKAIDWRKDTRVGARGKRKDVMDALRKRHGNYDKVFEDLQPMAAKWYPNALNSFPNAPNAKHAAERMLRWLINRVAYDYVVATEQHVSGSRAGYGESDKPQDVRRREARAAARKEREKATKGKAQKKVSRKGKTTAKKTGKAVGKGKSPAKKIEKKKTAAKGKGRK